MIIKVDLKDKALCNGCPALREEDGYCKAYSFIVAEHGASYTLQVTALDDSIIYKNTFDPTLFYSEGADESLNVEGGPVFLDDVNFFLVIPSTPETMSVSFLDSNGKVLFNEEVYNVGASSCRIR